ncbi:hypothetical protein DXG01_006853 [Tephrocybe rancida]|nr:hypothetical protein DXG01_006853 [Tephrocybe rancida]
MLIKSSTAAEPAPTSTEPGPPPYDAAWATLQHRTTAYQAADRKAAGPSSPAEAEAHAQALAAAMRSVGDSHPDPRAKGAWHQRAERFSRAGRRARRGILREGRGPLGALVTIPFVLVGTALRIVGGTVSAVGNAVGGLGDGLAGASGDRDRTRAGDANDAYAGRYS